LHQYKQHKYHFTNLVSEQNKIEKNLNLNKFERSLFKAARTFMFVKAYRLNVRHKVQYVSEIIFEELYKRHKLSINSFRYAQRKEILNFLLGEKVNMKEIAHRRNGIVEITENGKQKLVSLSKARSFLKKVLMPEVVTATNTINGQVAFMGKVQGRAKIVYSTSDMAKVNRGDVLFAITTTPDLLPAMNKAAAFVTDQGGITSHAAIVARELKKPCVIGTKIGTKIFKDGDMVEVDANKGVVRKI
jgi:phosphohistidine swiveling domain-containing protein